MTARERAKALAFYVKEETSEWTGHMIPRFMQEIEAAEREAWNAAIEAAAQVSNDFDLGDTPKSETARKITAEIKRLTK